MTDATEAVDLWQAQRSLFALATSAETQSQEFYTAVRWYRRLWRKSRVRSAPSITDAGSAPSRVVIDCAPLSPETVDAVWRILIDDAIEVVLARRAKGD